MHSSVWQRNRSLLYCPMGYNKAVLSWFRRFSQAEVSTCPAIRQYRLRPPHALKRDPCFWSGQWTQLQDLIYPGLAPPKRTPMVFTKQVLVLRLYTPVGGGMLLIHLRYNMVLQIAIHVVAFLSAACAVLPGTREDLFDRFFPRRKTESSNTIISRSSWTATTSCVFRKFMGKTNSSRLFVH